MNLLTRFDGIHIKGAKFTILPCITIQAPSKRKISKEDWERKLAAVELRKEDLNQLVMNFLVTEVGC